MSEAQQYRAQARSFERQAAEARRAEAREDFLRLAQLWNQLADEGEGAEQRIVGGARRVRASSRV